MIISSESYRRLASRAPATIQAGRAQYLTSPPSVDVEAAKLGARNFADEATRAFDVTAPTGTIDLDCSATLGSKHPATTPNLLARYLVIREGEELEFAAPATTALRLGTLSVIRLSGHESR